MYRLGVIMQRLLAMLFLIAGCCLAVLYVAGCSNNTPGGAGDDIVPPTNVVAWPPPEITTHHASDTESTILGKDPTIHQGGVGVSGDSLTMDGSLALPWAVYSIDAIGSANELVVVSVSFTALPIVPGDGTAIFIGLANHNLERWEWYSPISSPWVMGYPNRVDYHSDSGVAHVAVVLAGPGTGSVESVSFIHTADYALSPENLTAEVQDVELVFLDWDTASGAQGYNVYRATLPDLSDSAKINDDPVTPTEYTDDSLQAGKFYFYTTTGVAYNESDPSNTARIWAYEVDMPAPLNVRVSRKSNDWFTIEWDWAYAEPGGGFELFIDTEADFIIDQTTDNRTVYGFKPREYTFDNREEGVTYYVKMCALSLGGLRGRLSEEIPAATGDPIATYTAHGYVKDGDGSGIQDVTVSISGGDTGSATTDSTGYWEVLELDDGSNCAATPTKLGWDFAPISSSFTIDGGNEEVPDFVGTSYWWTWNDVNTIGPGIPPVRASTVGTSEIAVAYFRSSAVDLAVGFGDTWAVDTPLTSGYAMYLDMAYGGGAYIVAAFHLTTGDAWVATGTPGSWNPERIHGDGSDALGHRESGYNITAGASDSEFAVVHEVVPNAQNPQDPGMMLQTRPISGGTWTEDIIREFGDNSIVSLSTCFAWVGENLHILSTDTFTTEVFWGNRDGGWVWEDVLGGNGSEKYMPSGQDLHWFQDEWYTPGYSTGYKKLYMVHGTTLPWTIDEMNYGSAYGSYSRLAVEGSEAIMTHYGNGQYHMALYSKAWQHEPINAAGTSNGDYGPNADVVLLDGSPYLIFQDESDGNIKIAKGTPPE